MSVGSAGLGVAVALKKKGYMTQLSNVETALKDAPMPVPYNSDFKTSPDQPKEYIATVNKAFKATREELKTTQETLTTTTSKLADTEAKVQEVTTKLAGATKDLETAKTAQAEAETQKNEAVSQLKVVMDDLGGRNAKEVVAQLSQSQEKIQVIEREKKIVEDALAQKAALVAKFEEQDRMREQGYAPDDLSGRVVTINKDWNFVVLDVGKDNKLVEGVELVVYRGDSLIGKIKTVSVDATNAIADILPDATKSEIQIGDRVIFGYR
ncbi:MAG: hypothetical protein HC904_03365 [Blastochloris sp.]|nr:hypothetical protein [Blastochloris sp.]